MIPVGNVSVDPDAISEFCRQWKIRELSVFGSVLRDDFRPDSDIDFVAEFDHDVEWDLFDTFEMQEQLGQLVGRRVDLLDRAGVESSSNRFLKREILTTAERIHATISSKVEHLRGPAFRRQRQPTLQSYDSVLPGELFSDRFTRSWLGTNSIPHFVHRALTVGVEQ